MGKQQDDTTQDTPQDDAPQEDTQDASGDDGQEDTAPDTDGDSPDTDEHGSDGDSQDDDGADDVSKLPPWAQKTIRDLRREAAKKRTDAKKTAADEARRIAEEQSKVAVEKARAEAMDAVAKAFGLKEEEKELTPEEVVEKITVERDTERQAREERDQKYRELLVEVAVQDAAAMHDADPGKLLDSRKFMKEIGELDIDDQGYRVAVAKAVEAAVEEHSSYRVKTVKPPAVSGGTAATGAKVKNPEDMTIDELRKAGLHRRS